MKFIYVHNNNRMQLSFHVESPLYSASENDNIWNKFNITIEFSKLTSGSKFKQNLYDVIKERNFPLPEERQYSDIKMSISKSVINIDNSASVFKPSETKSEFTYPSSPNSSDCSFGTIKMSVTKKALRIDNSIQFAPISRSKVPSFSIKQVSKRSTKNLNSTDDEFWDFPKTGKPPKMSVNKPTIDSPDNPLSGPSNKLAGRLLKSRDPPKLDNKIFLDKVSQNSLKSVKNLQDRLVSLSTENDTPTKVKNRIANVFTYGTNLKKRIFHVNKPVKDGNIMTSSGSEIEMPDQEISDSSSRNKRAFKRQKRMEHQQSLVVKDSNASNENTSDNSFTAQNSENLQNKTGLQKKGMTESASKSNQKRIKEKAKNEQKKEQRRLRYQKKKEEDKTRKKEEEQLTLKKKKDLDLKKKEERQKKLELVEQKKDELAHENKETADKVKDSTRQQKVLLFQKEDFQHQKEDVQKEPDFSGEKQKDVQKAQEVGSQDNPSKNDTQIRLQKQSSTNATGDGVKSIISEKGNNQSFADLNSIQLDELLEMSIENLEEFDDSADDVDLPFNTQEIYRLQKEWENLNNQDIHVGTRFYKSKDLDEINVIESSIDETPERLETSNHKADEDQKIISEKQNTRGPVEKLAKFSGLAKTQTKTKSSESDTLLKPAGLLPSPIFTSFQKNYVSEIGQKQPLMDESVTFFEVKETSKVDDHLPWVQPTASQVQVNEKARVLGGLNELRDQVQVLLRGMTNALVKRLETMEKGVLGCDEKFEKWFLKEVGRVEEKTQTFAAKMKSSGVIEEANKYEAKLLKWIDQRNQTEISR